MEKTIEDKKWNMVNSFIEAVSSELPEKWNKWKLDLNNMVFHEVIGALLGRQVTLVVEIANSPGIWNSHIAPILLRAMADNLITIMWIFQKPAERAKLFVHYGLGQENLHIKHLEESIKERGLNPKEDPELQSRKNWVGGQRHSFLTEINLGNWADINTRKMAEAVGCLDLYRRYYSPYSSCVHNMWNHVAFYNLTRCTNPLHKHHGIPDIPRLGIDISYLILASELLDITYRGFETAINVEITGSKAHEKLGKLIEEFAEQYPNEIEENKK